MVFQDIIDWIDGEELRLELVEQGLIPDEGPEPVPDKLKVVLGELITSHCP